MLTSAGSSVGQSGSPAAALRRPVNILIAKGSVITYLLTVAMTHDGRRGRRKMGGGKRRGKREEEEGGGRQEEEGKRGRGRRKIGG